MRRTWTYVIVGILVFIVALAIAILFFTGGIGAYNGYGTYPGWMMGPYMMGGYGYGPYGWIGMILMLLIFLSVIGLIAFSVAWLVRSISGGSNPPVSWQTCSSCGRSIQADWNHCPYCGAQQR